MFKLLLYLKFLFVPGPPRKLEHCGQNMGDEGIPHEEEGADRPQLVATLVEVPRGEEVSSNITSGKDRVEEEEQTDLNHHGWTFDALGVGKSMR